MESESEHYSVGLNLNIEAIIRSLRKLETEKILNRISWIVFHSLWKEQTFQWMGGWGDGWMDRWMHALLDKQMHGWMNE